MLINSPCLNSKKELAIPEQTATSKESTNPLMADSLPKTIMPTKLVKPQDFNLRPNMARYGLTVKVGTILGIKEVVIKITLCILQQVFSSGRDCWANSVPNYPLYRICMKYILSRKKVDELDKFSESSSRCSLESRRKTHHNLRRTSASEERTKIRIMKSVTIGKWLTDLRKPSLK
ncbi:hypothetical protein Tco_0716901 [Tanacetum coccineum]